MTFRARPVRRTSRRSPLRDERRQQAAVAFGFVAVVVVAALMLGGIVAATYYGDHLAAVATVDGTGISRDQWNERQQVDRYRYVLLEQQIRSALSAGQLDQATAQQNLQYVQQQVAAIPSNALEALIDAVVQQKLATQEGITVTQAEVDQQLAKQATTPERRKVLAIFVTPGESPAAGASPGAGAGSSPAPGASAAPVASPTPSATLKLKTTPKPTATTKTKTTPKPSPTPKPSATPRASGTASTPAAPGGSPAPGSSAAPEPSTSPIPSGPTAAQRADALARATAALAALNAGTPFDQVAKAYSTDPSGTTGGSYGYMSATDSVDPAWVKAVFSLPLNGTTGVIPGADGTYRIGRVVDIVPGKTDANFQKSIEQAGVSLTAWRAATLADLYRQKLSEKVLADATSGNIDQVHAWEIRIGSAAASSGTAITGTQVEASRILYSPRGDAAGAPSIPANDPSWADAQKKAQATADKLRAIVDPAQRAAEFAVIARAESNDTASAASGGDLGWFTRATVVKEFADAVFAGTHTTDEIIGPVQTQYGYDVILFTAERAAPTDRVAAVQEALAQPNADFAAIAKANSDATDAPQGGDMGWIARWQDPGSVDTVVFGLRVGQVSAPVTRSDGVYIYRVSERAQRPVDASQKSALEATAFANWYEAQKSAATIWRSPDVASGSAASQGAGG